MTKPTRLMHASTVNMSPVRQTLLVLLAGAGACALATLASTPGPVWLAIGMSCVGKLDQLWRP